MTVSIPSLSLSVSFSVSARHSFPHLPCRSVISRASSINVRLKEARVKTRQLTLRHLFRRGNFQKLQSWADGWRQCVDELLVHFLQVSAKSIGHLLAWGLSQVWLLWLSTGWGGLDALYEGKFNFMQERLFETVWEHGLLCRLLKGHTRLWDGHEGEE